MCEFCTQHGEGQKWYLTARNYSRELLAQKGREEFIDDFMAHFEGKYGMALAKGVAMADRVKKLPLVPRLMLRMAIRKQKAEHWGQVVPIEDAEQIVDLTENIVRMPCVCRQMVTGREARYCFGMSIGFSWADLLGDYPDYSDSFEVLEREDAKKMLRSFDKQGMVHSVWTFKTPFLAGVCNCDQDCMAFRIQVKTGFMPVMFRSEYVGLVDWELCNGCKKCVLNCQYGAIHYSSTVKRPTIDVMRCYGCGVCRAVCDKDAITLKPRADFAGLPW